MKCFVEPCKNHDHQGNFCNNVCVPCYILAKDISKGNLKHSYHFSPFVVQFIADNWREILEQGELVQVGSFHHIYIGTGKPYKIHITHKFKDIYGDNLIIYIWYGRHKQWWHTTMEDEDVLKAKIERLVKEKS